MNPKQRIALKETFLAISKYGFLASAIIGLVGVVVSSTCPDPRPKTINSGRRYL